MSDIELVVVEAKRIAFRLSGELGASREASFHDRISEVQQFLDSDGVRTLRRIGAIRNDLVHDVGQNQLRNRRQFMADVELANRKISEAKARRDQAYYAPYKVSHVGAASNASVPTVAGSTTPAEKSGSGCAILAAALISASCAACCGVVIVAMQALTWMTS